MPELRNRLVEAGMNVPMPTLHSWRYGKRNPSIKTADTISSMIPLLLKSPESMRRKLIRFRVTWKMLEQSKTDPLMAGIAVSGANASLSSPMKLHFMTESASQWLPLADSVIWMSHVKLFVPESERLFSALLQLLAIKPNEWLECIVVLEPLVTRESSG